MSWAGLGYSAAPAGVCVQAEDDGGPGRDS